MPLVPEAHGDCRRPEEEPPWERVHLRVVRDEMGKEVKQKKTQRLADRCDRLSESTDEAWCEINGDWLDEYRKSIDLAVFHLGRAAGDLSYESMRKLK